jgi:cobalt-zinc-cadmium efflux system membrane fusion protein
MPKTCQRITDVEPPGPLHEGVERLARSQVVNARSWKPWTLALAAVLPGGALRAEVMGCLIEPDRVADVGSQSVGVIERLLVERGDTVASGQLVARLAAQVERASLSVAEARSQADAEVKQAEAAYLLAARKLERTKDLLKRDFVSDQALDQAEAEARMAEHRVGQAREAQRVSVREMRLSNAQLGQREVRSPFEGVVVERYRTEGERIEREPLVRVARLDPLRVEAIVPASQFGAIAVGQSAKVRTDLPSFAVLQAKVVLVDKVIDPGSNSFRIRLSLPNPDHRIPSGLRCKLDLGGAEAKAAPEAARPSMVPVTPAMPVTPAAPAAPALRPAVAPNPTQAPALPSARVVQDHRAPERMLVKQFITSVEPHLNLSRSMQRVPVQPQEPRRDSAWARIDFSRMVLSLR